MQESHLRPWGFAAAKERWKTTIAGTVPDMMAHLRHIGASGRQLRHKNNRQNRIYDFSQGRTNDFKFEIIYNHSKGHTTMLYHPARKPPWVRDNHKMSDKQLEESSWFQALPKHYEEAIIKAKNSTPNSPQEATS